MSKVPTEIPCGNGLDIANGQALYERLQAALGESFEIELQCADVDKADTAGLQILVAAIQEIEKNEGTVTWKEPSEKLLAIAESLGLYQLLQLPEQRV